MILFHILGLLAKDIFWAASKILIFLFTFMESNLTKNESSFQM